jgi:hypothetical protein
MRLSIEADHETEALLRAITETLSDDEIDQIDVKRSFDEIEGLAAEPVTIAAAIITASVPVMLRIIKLIDQHLERRHQQSAIKLVMEAHAQSAEAGKAVTALAKKHANVAVELGRETPPPAQT